MFRSANSMIGYSVVARDGKFGQVNDFLFDNKPWIVRYLVVETDAVPGRSKLLISPVALETLDWKLQTFQLNVTMEKILHSPEIDSENPIPRPLETALFSHYQWQPYWEDQFIDETTLAREKPAAETKEMSPNETSVEGLSNVSPRPEDMPYHLNSTDIVMAIQAVDGEIGHVEDYIVNSETWAINFLVVNTANWLPGKKVLISPQLINHMDPNKKVVFVNLMKAVVESSREFDPAQLVNTVVEDHLYDYYGRPQVEVLSRKKLFGF